MNHESTLHQARELSGQYEVPCNGCTRCCHSDPVRILPHEDATKWKTQPHPLFPGELMLAKNANGDCVYLGAGGCTAHADKPQQCRQMDCRKLAAAITFTRARKLQKEAGFNLTVWQRGRELLNDARP